MTLDQMNRIAEEINELCAKESKELFGIAYCPGEYNIQAILCKYLGVPPGCSAGALAVMVEKGILVMKE